MKTEDEIIYLDYAAACPLDPEIAGIFTQDFLAPGNPSSVHRVGQRQRKKIDRARALFRDLLGLDSEKQLTFYGSGTEAIWSALTGLALEFPQASHILVSQSEHAAVVETLKLLEAQFGLELEWVMPDENGLHHVDDFVRRFRPETRLCVMMAVNNETGVVQPVKELAERARAHGVLSFCDACQLGSRKKISMEAYPVDAMVLNSSKLYGPVGHGLLYLREGVAFRPMMTGGGQEFRRRGGTENADGIFAFAKAFEKCQSMVDAEKIAALSLFFEEALGSLDGVKILGGPRVPGLWTVYVPWMTGESLVMRLDIDGFAVSSGSACSSGVVKASPVLLSMGLTEEASRHGLRISLGRWTETEHLKKLIESLHFIRESLL